MFYLAMLQLHSNTNLFIYSEVKLAVFYCFIHTLLPEIFLGVVQKRKPSGIWW